MSGILKGLNENRDTWDSNMPGYQGDYGGEKNWGRRNKASDENDAIDARLRQQDAQRREYEQSGKFWLKLKDTQQHLPAGPFTGKQSANQAALDLLKKQPELKGNLLITAYGPDEKNVAEAKEADYGADYQDMVRRVKQLAKEGPRKVVWDPEKRVYKTVPVNPPKKAEGVEEAYPGHIEKGKELDAATKKIQANLDRRIRGHELDAATKEIQKNLDKRIKKVDQGVAEDWQKVNKKDKTDGMSRKAVKAYRRENPGSKLKTAVTKKPSKIKKGSADDKRRKSFCARMSGMKKAHASAKTKRDPDSPINKALRRWNCESVEQMQELVMIAEQKITEAKNAKQQAAIAIAKKKAIKESSDICSVCGQTPCNCTHVSSIMEGITK